MSALWITIDVLIAAIWRTVWPNLDDATSMTVIVTGVIVLVYKIAKDF